MEGDGRERDDDEDVNHDREEQRPAAPLSHREIQLLALWLHATPAVRLANTFAARRAASAMRSGAVMKDTRKNPSPPAPNAEPGMMTTPSSSKSRSAKSPLGTSSGNRTQRYIVARGISQTKPALRKDRTAASR